MKSKRKPADPLLNRIITDNTPLPGNICKAPGCGGLVVKKPTPSPGRRPRYNSNAECLKCDKVYLYAADARRVTKEEADSRELSENRKAS